jgi:hypothetical protein
MAKSARLIAMFAIIGGLSTAAFAQAATSPHLHATPPTAAQSAPAQPQQKADHQDGCPCPCCQMMMQMMEKHMGDAGCMQKMKMMQGQGAQEKPAPPPEHEKH